MKINLKFTLTGALNLMLVYCLLRFGLVFTAGFRLFGLTYVVVIGAGVVFLHSLVSKRYLGRLLQVNVLFLFLNILFAAVAKELTVRTDYVATASNYINQLIVLLLLWGFYLYMQVLDAHRRKRLVWLYLAVVAVSSAYTFYVAMIGSHNVIRNTAFSQYDSGFPLRYGGFDFIYGLDIVYAALLVVLIEGKERISKSKRVCLIVLLVLTALTIIVSGFSTAFMLILVITILKVPKSIFSKAFWIVLVAFSILVIPQQLVKLIESIPFMPEITSSRVSDLILSVTGQGTSDYITDDGQRLDRIMWSLQAFWEHPLLGQFAGNGTSALGYHTEWIDQLARYGLLTTICNALFWVNTYGLMEYVSRKTPITHKCIKSAFIVYLILGFLNPISMVVTSAPLFLLCPFAEELIDSGDRRLMNESK